MEKLEKLEKSGGAKEFAEDVEVTEVAEVQAAAQDEVKEEQKWNAAKCSYLSPRMG